MRAGTRTKEMFFILEGAARGFIVNPEGEEKTILLRGKGIFVSDADGLFSDSPQVMEIASIGESKVLFFSFPEFEDLALNNKNILQIYLNGLKESILRLLYRIRGMVLMSSEERYLDLLKLNPAFLEKSYDKYVANYLGITPVSLSRIKKKLNNSELTKDKLR